MTPIPGSSFSSCHCCTRTKGSAQIVEQEIFLGSAKQSWRQRCQTLESEVELLEKCPKCQIFTQPTLHWQFQHFTEPIQRGFSGFALMQLNDQQLIEIIPNNSWWPKLTQNAPERHNSWYLWNFGWFLGTVMELSYDQPKPIKSSKNWWNQIGLIENTEPRSLWCSIKYSISGFGSSLFCGAVGWRLDVSCKY